MRTHRLTVPLLALALAPAACGGSGEQAPTTTTVARAPAAQAPKIPTDLLGTRTTTLRAGDLPAKFRLANPFHVRIAPKGGVDDGPSFAIADGEQTLEGEVTSPVFAGDTVTLRQEGCFTEGVGYRFHDNVYRYTLSGDTLRFTVVRNACPDRFAESILTSRTFRRAS